jgi:ABC-type transporter MlaC component
LFHPFEQDGRLNELNQAYVERLLAVQETQQLKVKNYPAPARDTMVVVKTSVLKSPSRPG